MTIGPALATSENTAERTLAIWPNRLIFGTGTVARLGELVRELGGQRALVICGNTVNSGPILPMVSAGLGDLYAGVYPELKAHTPTTTLQELVSKVDELGVDTVVSVGGGSAIDAGKALSMMLAAGGDLLPYSIRYRDAGMDRARLVTRPIIHIAVPTTSGSSSEVLPTSGIRDVSAGRKILFWDDLLIPDAAILDPNVAVYAGPELTASSGMTAVARCVEALYSKDRNPLSTGLALQGLRLLRRSLPIAVTDPTDLNARSQCQYACIMSGVSIINSMASLVHAVGHVVGGSRGLQHGISHAILLAPAMRLMLPTLGEDQRDVMAALSDDPSPLAGDAAGQAAANIIEELVRSLPIPKRLRDVGIEASEIDDLVHHAQGEYMMANLPRPVSAEEIGQMLRLAH